MCARVCVNAITDVVLPLPGNAVEYPRHSLAQFYSELMDGDVGMDLKDLRHTYK